MSYRDDREALRQQLEELRREVEDLRAASGDDKAVAERIAAVTAEVKSALERMDEDRDVLQKLATSLRSLKRDIGDESKDEDVAKPTKPEASSPASNTWVKPAIVVVGCLVAVAVAWNAIGPAKPPPPPPDPLAGIAGAPKAVDVLALLQTAKSRVPSECALESIDAWYVSEDGTLDLTSKTYGARVKYTFVAPEPPPPPVDSSLPLGAPKPIQLRKAPASGCFELTKTGFVDCGDKDKGALFIIPRHTPQIPMPTCSARQVWDAAKSAGAPSGAVAHLVYSHELFKKSASWKFVIEDTKHSYEVSDPGCAVTKNNDQF